MTKCRDLFLRKGSNKLKHSTFFSKQLLTRYLKECTSYVIQHDIKDYCMKIKILTVLYFERQISVLKVSKTLEMFTFIFQVLKDENFGFGLDSEINLSLPPVMV